MCTYMHIAHTHPMFSINGQPYQVLRLRLRQTRKDFSPGKYDEYFPKSHIKMSPIWESSAEVFPHLSIWYFYQFQPLRVSSPVEVFPGKQLPGQLQVVDDEEVPGPESDCGQPVCGGQRSLIVTVIMIMVFLYPGSKPHKCGKIPLKLYPKSLYL